MVNLPRPLRRLYVIAGLAVLAASSQAFILDGQISIDRALNSPTLTVRYSNASAALVELRVNGESVATRSVNAGKSAGETSFNLNLSTLTSGDNKVEIRLFDKGGKLLATEQTTVTTEQAQGPVFITNPKMGANVRGSIDIKVGFGKELKNSYISFFIDNQFKSISNVPPYQFTWDTSRDSNGWHEVEAWIVDETSSTFKTKKIRVFVDNVGGRTDRINPEAAPLLAKAQPASKALEGAASNSVRVKMSDPLALKPVELHPSTAMGPKSLLPTGNRLAKANPPKAQKPPTATVTNSVTGGIGTMAISHGQRLPNIGTFAIVYNTQFVDFDVQPRVTNGVPLTPFRYLIEKAGGKVSWAHKEKNVSAQADGHDIFLHIGDSFAQINKKRVDLEQASFLDHGRTIVPLSFMQDALNVAIEYDKATGHVLITSIKK
jgi:hypothetical protein